MLNSSKVSMILIATVAVALFSGCDLTVTAGVVGDATYGPDCNTGSSDIGSSTSNDSDDSSSGNVERHPNPEPWRNPDGGQGQKVDSSEPWRNPNGGQGRVMHALSAHVEVAGVQKLDPRVEALVNKYEISSYAATYLVRAIVLAQMNDTSGIKDLGLQVSDFRDVYSGRAMSRPKLEALSNKLLLSVDDTERVVGAMTKDIQTYKK